jgi:hypothetical protein
MVKNMKDSDCLDCARGEGWGYEKCAEIFGFFPSNVLLVKIWT